MYNPLVYFTLKVTHTVTQNHTSCVHPHIHNSQTSGTDHSKKKKNPVQKHIHGTYRYVYGKTAKVIALDKYNKQE